MRFHHALLRQDALAAGEAEGARHGGTWAEHVPRAAVHELYAARQADAGAVAGCAAAMGYTLTQGKPLLWVRHTAFEGEAGGTYGAGVLELGLDPSRLILLRARDVQSALQASLEGARCSGLGAVVVELWGETRIYDLTASRRLAFAAKASGTPLFLVRTAARPQPSAADTRWLISAAPSGPLAANAPGHPCFALTLLRTRKGQEGLSFHLEWNRDARTFDARQTTVGPASGAPSEGDAPSPLSGTVVPLSFDRPDAAFAPARAFSKAG